MEDLIKLAWKLNPQYIIPYGSFKAFREMVLKNFARLKYLKGLSDEQYSWNEALEANELEIFESIFWKSFK